MDSLCSMDMILSFYVVLVEFLCNIKFWKYSVDPFHLAWKCFGGGEAPEQQLPIPHNWGGGNSLAGENCNRCGKTIPWLRQVGCALVC